MQHPSPGCCSGGEKESGAGRSCNCPFLSQPLPCPLVATLPGLGRSLALLQAAKATLLFHPPVLRCLIAVEELGEVTLCAVSRKKRLLA